MISHIDIYDSTYVLNCQQEHRKYNEYRVYFLSYFS